MILFVLVVISKTYMASKSAHRLLATYNSSTDFRFCSLHSAIIFSRSSIDFSSAAIRASLGEKGKKKRGFQNFYAFSGFTAVTHLSLGLTLLLSNYPSGYFLLSPHYHQLYVFPRFLAVTYFPAVLFRWL